MLPLHRSLVLSLLGLAPAGLAQDAATPLDLGAITAAAVAAGLDTVLYDAPAPGVVLARGATWKASFTPEGAEYVPFLGEDAPRNFPVRFRLEGATLGGAPLALAPRPSVRRTGDRVVIDHGAVLEVYDLAPDSIEQSFVLPRRSARGEVRVRLAVESELLGGADGRGLRFDGAHGGVRYGEAFALDAAGRRADVASTLAGGTIELTVPDAFPVEGTGELVIDPVITTLAPTSSTVGARNADVAFEKDVAGGGIYVVVYETGFSATDRDLHAVEVRAADGAVLNLGAIDISSDDTAEPAVAGNDGANSFLVAYERRAAGSSQRDVWARVRLANSTAISPPQRVSEGDSGVSSGKPDVGGDNKPFPGYWGVVWERNQGGVRTVRGRAVATTGSPTGNAVSLSGAGTINDGEVTISEGSATPFGQDLFAFAYARGAVGDRDVYTGEVRLGFNGMEVVQTAYRLGQAGDVHAPSVSNMTDMDSPVGRPVYAVAAQVDQDAGDEVTVFLCAGGTVLSVNDLSEMQDDLLAQDYATPAIAWTGSAFVLTYASHEGVHMATAYAPERGNSLVLALAERARPVRHSNNGADGLRPALVSEWEAGALGSREALVAYDNVPAGGAFRSVHLGRLEQHTGTRAIGTQYCGTAFNSALTTAWMSMFGSQDAASSKIVLVEGLPVGQFAMLVNSRDRGLVLNPSGSRGNLCLGGQIGRMLGSVTQPLPSGTAFFVVDTGALETATGVVAGQPGETWRFQAWFRDTYQGMPTSNFSNAVEVELR